MKPKLTTKEYRMFLPAIKELRERYEKFPMMTRPEAVVNCPLCSVVKILTKEPTDIFYEEKCSFCLWFLFEGGHCYAEHHFQRTTIKTRLDRLDRWEKKIRRLYEIRQTANRFTESGTESEEVC